MRNILLVLLLTIPFVGFSQGWEKTFGGPTDDQGTSVQETNDGGFIITGYKDFDDVFLIKTDGNGHEQWNKTFGGWSFEFGFSVKQTIDGGYIIAGHTLSFGVGNGDVYLIKTDGSGNELWNKTFGGSSVDYGYSVQQSTDGGYIIVGYSSSFGNQEDVYLIKTDSNGNVTSIFNTNSYLKKKLKKVIDILGKETKPNFNNPFIEIYDDGSTKRKLIIKK